MIKLEDLEKEIAMSETSLFTSPECAEFLDREGYYFCQSGEFVRVFDSIIIINHDLEISLSPRYPKSIHSLEEHIKLINELGLKKALIIGTDIGFVRQCPTLKHLVVYPSHLAGEGFDYSPLYDLSEINSLVCQTRYGKREEFATKIDYSKIKGLRSLSVCGEGHLNYNRVGSLEKLQLANFRGKKRDLTDAFCSCQLKELSLIQCGISSLNGIAQSTLIDSVRLAHCRCLEDASQLLDISRSLTKLDIINCHRISDFSFLHDLANLEHLSLDGKNIIPDLSFLPNMPKLKSLNIGMKVEDGDLSNCLNVPHVNIVNHKHYNLQNSQLPKNNMELELSTI